MYRPAGTTGPVYPCMSLGEQPLDLAELSIRLLQLRRAAGEDVEAVVVADGHLVGEAAEIPGERGDALGELDAQTSQLGERAAGGGGLGGGGVGGCAHVSARFRSVRCL